MEKLLVGIIALAVIVAVVLVLTLPLMLFLGNVGVNVSFLGSLPGALALGLIGVTGSNK